MIQEKKITSLKEYINETFTNSYNKEIGRIRSNYVFRGQSLVTYKLETSLMRNCKSKIDLEYNMLRNFRKYAATLSSLTDNEWDTLVLAQHHVLPTRLLDWSFSSLIALHFATEDMNYMQSKSLYQILTHYKEIVDIQ